MIFCNKSVKSFYSIFSWQAIQALTALIMACFTAVIFYQTKISEEGEIAEEIIIPLKQDLENIIKNLQDKLLVSSWNWSQIRDKKIRLIKKHCFESIKKDIGDFHKYLSPIQSLSHSQYKDLEDLIKQEIKNILEPEKKINLESTECTLLIGGDFTRITFFRLIFERCNLDECIKNEQRKRYERGVNQDLSNEIYYLNGVKINGDKREDFNKIADAIILKELENKLELQKYVEECRILSDKAYELEKKFNSFY